MGYKLTKNDKKEMEAVLTTLSLIMKTSCIRSLMFEKLEKKNRLTVERFTDFSNKNYDVFSLTLKK